MEYKRLEIYVWWTCNHKCTYCKEYPNMEILWNKKVTKYDILKLLIKYKKKWYNHVSYLWWEPFIQPVFLDALKLWKKLWYTILVTTNCSTLHIDNQASKFLPYIDELILSIEAIDKEKQQIISRTKNYVIWDKVFDNIKKYWNWKLFKANIVITKDNLKDLFLIVSFCINNNFKEIAVTYPDIDLDYYGKKHILNKVAPKYSDCVNEIINIVNLCEINKVNLKLPDFPFCVFPKKDLEKYISLTDDYDYQTRLNIFQNTIEFDRWDLKTTEEIPRQRSHLKWCLWCIYINLCWGVSIYYKKLYWLDEINHITK